MNREDLIKELNDIFRDVIDEEEIVISEETSMDSLELWDSFVHISLLAIIQDRFKIHFVMDEIMEMNTVKAIINAIERKQM